MITYDIIHDISHVHMLFEVRKTSDFFIIVSTFRYSCLSTCAKSQMPNLRHTYVYKTYDFGGFTQQLHCLDQTILNVFFFFFVKKPFLTFFGLYCYFYKNSQTSLIYVCTQNLLQMNHSSRIYSDSEENIWRLSSSFTSSYRHLYIITINPLYKQDINNYHPIT